jgi:hypothetical protein
MSLRDSETDIPEILNELNSHINVMSAGGQNSSGYTAANGAVDSGVKGITGMRIRDSADVVAQVRVRQIYQLFNSNAPTAVRPRIRNGNDVYLQYLEGVKEVSSNVTGTAACPACAGLTYNGNGLVLTYRNGNYPPV